MQALGSTHIFSIFFIATVFSSVFYFDGFLYLLGRIDEAGQFNPVLGIILMFALTSFSLLIMIKNALKVDRKLVIALCLLMLGFHSLLFGGELSQLVRDVVYLILTILVALLAREFLFGESGRRIFAVCFFLMQNLIYPLIGLSLGFSGYEERFAGFSLSPPVFAFGIFIGYVLLRLSVKSGLCIVLAFSISAYWIYESQTRTEIILLVCFEILVLTSKLRRIDKAFIYSISLVGIGALTLFLGDEIWSVLSKSQSTRVLSVSDIEQGSLATRIAWYAVLLAYIWNNSFLMLGGFGSGAAEELIGFVAHFDFLRYWFDYGLLFLFLSVLALICMAKALRVDSQNKLKFEALVFVVLFFLLLSMHNILQSPSSIILIPLILVFMLNDHRLNENNA